MRLHLRKSPPHPVKPLPPADPNDDHLGAKPAEHSRRLTPRAIVRTSLGFLALILLIVGALALFTGCDAKKPAREEVLNVGAAIPGSLPYQPLRWPVITQFVDPATHTMATLYGNEPASKAAQYAAAHPAESLLQIESPTPTDGSPLPGALPNVAYPTGSVLALVTWVQREDPHWFGARIPGNVQSVEFVAVDSSAPEPMYRRFVGNPLREETALDPAVRTARTGLLMSQTAIKLP